MREDDALIQRVAAGDSEAFARLVAPHRAELARFASRILAGDAQAGEEAAQEALLSAYRALRAGARPKSVRPWLFAIIRNHALNQLRRSRPTCALADRDGHLASRTPNEAAEQGEWIDWLMGAIAALPARQRQALVGRELEGRSHAELAASLDTSVLAVKTLLHRARGTLRRLRPDSMLSVPLLVKARLAGVKAAGGVATQALLAASVSTLIVLAVHAGGAGPVRAAGLPGPAARSALPLRRLRAPRPARAPNARAALSADQVRREGARAIARCDRGLSLRGTSPAALRYAIGHLSAAELEYSECEQAFRAAMLEAGREPPRADVRFAQSPDGLLGEEPHRTRLAVEPSSIVVFPHGDWSIVGLHWSEWSWAAARATGTSLEAECEPGCGGGPPPESLRRSPARVILWNPGRLDGQTVYRCFSVSAQDSVPSSVSGCSAPVRGSRPPA